MIRKWPGVLRAVHNRAMDAAPGPRHDRLVATTAEEEAMGRFAEELESKFQMADATGHGDESIIREALIRLAMEIDTLREEVLGTRVR
jgi:hypothetical protein